MLKKPKLQRSKTIHIAKTQESMRINHHKKGVTILDWMNFMNSPLPVIKKLVYFPLKIAIEKHMGNFEEVHIKTALASFVVGFGMMLKSSSSVRSWSSSLVKFVFYLGTLIGIFILGILLALKTYLKRN